MSEAGGQRARLVVPAAELERVRARAAGGYPHEVCGFLVGRRGPDGRIEVLAAWPAENVREEDRARRYLIDPADYLAAERAAEGEDRALVGFYHSHPDAPARPSEHDREHAWPTVAYLIVAVADGEPGEATAWRLADDRSRFEPLEIEIGAMHPEEEESEPCPRS